MKKEGEMPTGVKIRTLNYVMIIIGLILYGFILYGMIQISSRYNALVQAINDYVDCEKCASLVDEGSDILTEQSRLYVVTGEKSYAEAYFKEANVDRKREKALEKLEKLHAEDETQHFLEEALSYSNTLMEREIYAMRLRSEAEEYDMDSLPEAIGEVELTGEDAGLGREEKRNKAIEMLFDTEYRDEKTLIENNISYSLSSLQNATKKIQSETALELKEEIQAQRVEISALFAMNVVIFFFITILIIKPLQIYIKCIKDNKALEIVGAYEFRYLAITYNDIYELNVANQLMLKKKAEHDPLTGLLNRGAFDQMRQNLRMNMIPISLLLIDVDEFKQVNDHYGHDVGDQVLKKVASLLNHNFRCNDFVARIGGDEFAVIMVDMDNEKKDLIEKKVADINQALMAGGDGLPPVSLSVGVAFSQQGFDDALFQRADLALYQVKKMGRCGCTFESCGYSASDSSD